MSSIAALYRREFYAYFASPLAYIFLVIFLILTGVFTFYLGSFYQRDQADLESFFTFHPWLYLFLVPAIAMRLWAEERKSGTIELLLTLPLGMWEAVVAKFLAAWTFLAVALALTFPMWITCNYLGNPDNTVIAAGYIGSLFMAGGFLAIGSCISAFTKNQVIAFVISVVICFLFIVSGFPLVLDFFRAWAPQAIVNLISSFSFLQHFNSIQKGVIDARDVVYFGTLIAFWLYANTLVISAKKAS